MSFVRRGDDPADDLVILINFDVNAREDFRLGVPEWGVYAEKFNSDAAEFGGSGVLNEGRLRCEDVAWNGREQSVVLRVPPLAGIVLKKVAKQARPKKAAEKTAAAKVPAASAKKPAAKAAAKKTSTPKPAAKAPAKKATPAKKTATAKKPAAKAKLGASKNTVKVSSGAK